MVDQEKRQAFDLPERLLWVTEHRALIHACPRCRGQTRAAFPDGVTSPAQYGERIRAAAVYLNAQQLVPEERVAQVLADLFGAATACGASVAAWARAKAAALEPVYRAIGECVAGARVRRLDETGLRIAARPVGCTPLRRRPTRSIAPASRVRPCSSAKASSWFTTIGAHTHGLAEVDHADCNAHLLRELQAVSEFDREPWAEALSATLLDANKAVRDAKARSASALECEAIKLFEERYWAAVREGLALHRSLPAFDGSTNAKKRKKQRPAHNLLNRFKTFKEETLRFLTDFEVPFTNNLPEQDLRMMKAKMKISGGFRTEKAPPTSPACDR